MKIRIALLPMLLLAPLGLLAQETEESGPWTGKASLGYLATSGNTENSTLNTAVEVSYSTGQWVHTAKAFALNASENEQPTAEAYDFGWKSERKLTDHDFLYARAKWRKDVFGAYATQFSQTLGYGRRLIDNDAHSLNAEVGIGARQSELQDTSEENETVYTGGLYYAWQLSETAQFRQDLSIEAGDENRYTESVTALSAKLLGDLALVASYTIKHNSDVPPSTEKTDRYTALSLEYSF